MKSLEKYFFTLIIGVFFALSSSSIANAYMPPVYPIYGYNSQENICQVKQSSEKDPVLEQLSGEYWSLRECRSENPQIIFHTGLGIIIWLGLLFLIITFQYCIYPLFQKRNKLEKKIFFISDVFIIGIVLFFNFLLFHYFSVPHAFYDYGSDIDHILYMTLIRSQIPIYYISIYFIISIIRTAVMYIESKNKK